MQSIYRLRVQGLALIGACGLVLGGMGCREEQRPLPTSVSETRSSFVSTSSSVVAPREAVIDTRVFFLESPGILERGFERAASCSTPRTPDAILFMGHYPPGSSRFLETLSAWDACAARAVKHVVLLSPDHHQRLETGFVTTDQIYRGRAQELRPRPQFLERLQERSATSSSIFMQEHGIGVPLAIVNTYWPQLESATAIVVSRKISEADARELAQLVRRFANEPETLVVFSVDFSHGLPRVKARVRDQETRRALLEARRPFFWYAQDVHTDFGRGLWILLSTLTEGGRVSLHQSFDAVDLGGEGTSITTFFTGWLTRD